MAPRGQWSECDRATTSRDVANWNRQADGHADGKADGQGDLQADGQADGQDHILS